ncbi:MAG: cobalamin-dependent protein [Nanoarchaeota archaeon]|nr:cobalamin-dependent protein [Nanoarchaeota archaeon]
MGKKVLLVGSYSIIEPLGLMVLSQVAREEGWDPSIELIKEQDFGYLERIVSHLNPQIIGASVYTGNHVQLFNWLDQIKKERPELKTVVGGPHPTLNPKESKHHADYVVVSEGIEPFRKILRGESKESIIFSESKNNLPLADRKNFYNTSRVHRDSPIKSIITSVGCPHNCGHCYNSVRVSHLKNQLGKNDFQALSKFLGGDNSRLFPKSIRSVKDICLEVEDILNISPETKLIFDQSDIHGKNLNWLKEFAKEFPKLGVKYHALLRFEYADPNKPKSKERIDLMKQAGCTGLTFAIESGIPCIRDEVLKRKMDEELMFRTFSHLKELDFKVRTQQMLGLPYGATSQETPINLDADLKTLELNVRLRQETGLPAIAWASIYTPYLGTETGNYCRKHGFYSGNNDDIHPTFFTRSVLRFPKKWIGPNLSAKNQKDWLSEEEQETYRDKLQMLRDIFTDCSRHEDGHIFAKNLVENEISNKSNASKYAFQSTQLRNHLYNHELYCVR